MGKLNLSYYQLRVSSNTSSKNVTILQVIVLTLMAVCFPTKKSSTSVPVIILPQFAIPHFFSGYISNLSYFFLFKPDSFFFTNHFAIKGGGASAVKSKLYLRSKSLIKTTPQERHPRLHDRMQK